MKRVKRYISLKAWRLANGLSQREAAQILGVTQARYGRIELRRNSPRPLVGAAISAKTGVAFEVIMRVA